MSAPQAPAEAGRAPRFFFVRHGETDWNRDGRLQGQRDIPLNGRGRDQAASVGRTLRQLAGRRGLDVAQLDFVSSPLGRTCATMELLRPVLGLSGRGYRTDHRLKEIAFGRWEGLTWPEIKAADPALYAERKRGKWSFEAPGGESYAGLVERIRPWVATAGDNAVVVSHGGVARAMLTLLAGVDTGTAPAVDIWQGRVLSFADGRADWV